MTIKHPETQVRGDPPPTAEVPILEVRGLSVSYVVERRPVPVVTDLSFKLHRGETLGIIGESGSGKTTVALAILRILPPAAYIEAGTIEFLGRDLFTLPEPAMNTVRGAEIAMIFQEPMTSLNPAFSIGDHIAEAYRAHNHVSRRAAREHAVEMLSLVGIPDPARRIHQYPHQFSGGMRQRALIALALSSRPRVLVADEPTTALDVTTQAQILDLLRNLARRFQMATVFITHDLGVAAELCDRVLVMYAGEPVEVGSVSEVFCRPRHPYTERLLACTSLEHRDALLGGIPGEAPRAGAFPSGCRFHPRCAYALPPRCAVHPLALQATDEPEHRVRCARHRELALAGVCA